MRAVVFLAALAVIASACGSTAAAPSLTPLATAPVIRTAAPTVPPGAGACAVKQIAFVKAPSKATITLQNGGTIVVALRPDKAPKTVTNFANVAMSGCYDGLVFHRVVPSFVIQGGDPLGTGTGGGTQPAEYNDLPFTVGSIGIARGGDKALNNDRQFFICTTVIAGQGSAGCGSLTNEYTNFGQVTSGQNVADAVKIGDKIKTIVVE